MLFYTTPVPRAVFRLISELKDAELRVLLVIVHKTLGWKDKTERTRTGRKEKDWIAGSQFVQMTGLSQRAIGLAIESLFVKGHVIVTDTSGALLDTPAKRKGKTRMFYELSIDLKPVTEDYSLYLRRRISDAANKMRITSYNR